MQGVSKRVTALVVAIVALVVVVVVMRSRIASRAGATSIGTGGAPGASSAVLGAVAPSALGAIEGKVLGVGGSPRAGVIVALRSARLRRSVVTDEAGAFAVHGLAPATLTVSAGTSDGEAASAVVEIPSNATAHIDLRLSALADGVSLGGHVRDILGGVVSGAEVWIGAEKGGPTAILKTGPEGEFTVRVPKGEHELRVRAEGYAEAAESISLASDLVVDVVVHPAASIHGVVVRADGNGVAGVAVHCSLVRGDDHFETTTDVDGKFELASLRGGSYDLEATSPTELSIMRGVNVAPTSARDVRIELEPSTFVAGRISGPDGAPVAGAEVTVKGDSSKREAVKTGPDGRYRITNVQPGLVAVRACASTYACAESKEHIVATGPPTDVDVTLSTGARVRVLVVDANDKPVTGAHASLADYEGCDTTNGGECTIERVPPKHTKLSASHVTAGYGERAITIEQGETRHEIKLAKGATVRGKVHWDDGKPAAGVHVFAYENVTRTKPDGSYELVNVQPGYLNLRADAAMELGERRFSQMFDWSDGPRAATFEKVIAGQVREDLDLVLPRRSKHIAGTVVGPEGAPVAFARVGLKHDDGRTSDIEERFDDPFATVATYSGPDGTFTIEAVADGKHIVWADADELPKGRARGVAAGAENVKVELPAASIIEGVVKDERGSVVTAYVVRVSGVRQRVARVASDQGRFTLGGLAAGRYKLAFEGYRVANAAPLSGSLIAELDELTVGAGEKKSVEVVARTTTALTGRVVAWPEMTPLAGIELMTHGPLWRRASPTGSDGRFRIEGLPSGMTELWTHDVGGEQENWMREVPVGSSTFDLGDLATAQGKRGGLSFAFESDGRHAQVAKPYGVAFKELGFIVGDEILSVGGRPVAMLGAESLAGVIADVTPEVPVVVKRDGETDPKTLHREHRSKPAAHP